MPPEHTILMIFGLFVVVAILLIVLGQAPPVQKPLVKQKKFQQAKAKTNYKQYVAMKRQSAIKNYENYLKHQRRLARQHNINRIGRQARRVFGEAFPEFESGAGRGAFIRAIIAQLIQSLSMGQGGLSPAWQKQLDDFLNDVNGVLIMKQELNRWQRERQAEIRADFEAGNISEEQMHEDLQELKNIYEDAMQRIAFS